MIKKILLFISLLLILLVGFAYWFVNLLPGLPNQTELKATRPEQLAYLVNKVDEKRGKILAVVTSTSVMGNSGKATGYELTELSRAYYVFSANGFEVDIASPLGGKPPVVLDDDDMGHYDYAFLNDVEAQQKANNTLPIDQVDPNEYQAVYFVGGKGAMYDFPDNKAIQALIQHHHENGKVISAVCHGPAALVNATDSDGHPIIANKRVSSFTNSEELLLIPEAKEIFPFLLQDKLTDQGANFIAGPDYLNQVSHDGNIITGQNPWSVWQLTETVIRQLGYQPIERKVTPNERSVNILLTYEKKGLAAAKTHLEDLVVNQGIEIDRIQLAMYSVVAAMGFELSKFSDLTRLLSFAKDLDEKANSI